MVLKTKVHINKTNAKHKTKLIYRPHDEYIPQTRGRVGKQNYIFIILILS